MVPLQSLSPKKKRPGCYDPLGATLLCVFDPFCICRVSFSLAKMEWECFSTKGVVFEVAFSDLGY